VAVATNLDYLAGLLPSGTASAATTAVERPVEDSAAGLAAFRREFYRCLTRRASVTEDEAKPLRLTHPLSVLPAG
jgi:hypothetical protein